MLPHKLSVQPLPPPHVSLTPPYQQLTLWIRDLLAQNQLTFSQIKALRKPFRVVTKSNCKPRTHRVECIIYPSTDFSDSAAPLVVQGRRVSIVSQVDSERTEDPVEPIYSAVNKVKEPSIPSGEPRTPVQLTEPDSNPFGFIRYIDSSTEDVTSDRVIIEDDDLITLVLPGDQAQQANQEHQEVEEEYLPYNDNDMMFLLPKSLLQSQSFDSSHCLSAMGSSQESEGPVYASPGETAPWGRRLPPQPGQWSPAHRPYNQRVASDGFYQGQVQRNLQPSSSVPVLPHRPRRQEKGLSDSDSSGRDSPPSWISCFRSPKTRRKSRGSKKGSGESQRCSSSSRLTDRSRPQPQPIRFIDDSVGSSVDNLYSSPRLVDYEDFAQAESFSRISRASKAPSVKGMKRKSRSLSRTKYNRDSDLSVIPVREMEGLDLKLSHNSGQTTAAQVHHYPPPPPYTYPPPPVRCICDSRRSSDSGLADVSSHADICPLSPLGKGSLQSVTSIPQYPSSPRLSRVSNQGSYSARTQVRQDINHNLLLQSDPHRNISYIDAGSVNSMYPSTPSIVRCSCGQEFGFPPHLPPSPASPSIQRRSLRTPKSPIMPRKFKPQQNLSAQHSVSLDDLDRSRNICSSPDQALSCTNIPAYNSAHRAPMSYHAPATSAPPAPAVPSQAAAPRQSPQQQRRSNPSPAAPPKYYTQHTMISTDQTNWNRTKVNYKSGLYAHWWMNASLQPISEEGLDQSNLSQH